MPAPDARSLLGAALVLALLAAAAANIWFRVEVERPALQPVQLRDEPELLAGAMRTVRRHYELYFDIREVGSGGHLVAPLSPPFSPDHARAFGWVEVATVDYDPTIGSDAARQLRGLSHASGDYWPRGSRDDVPYVVVGTLHGGHGAVLWTLTYEETILIVPELVLEELGMMPNP